MKSSIIIQNDYKENYYVHDHRIQGDKEIVEVVCNKELEDEEVIVEGIDIVH